MADMTPMDYLAAVGPEARTKEAGKAEEQLGALRSALAQIAKTGAEQRANTELTEAGQSFRTGLPLGLDTGQRGTPDFTSRLGRIGDDASRLSRGQAFQAETTGAGTLADKLGAFIAPPGKNQPPFNLGNITSPERALEFGQPGGVTRAAQTGSAAAQIEASTELGAESTRVVVGENEDGTKQYLDTPYVEKTTDKFSFGAKDKKPELRGYDAPKAALRAVGLVRGTLRNGKRALFVVGPDGNPAVNANGNYTVVHIEGG